MFYRFCFILCVLGIVVLPTSSKAISSETGWSRRIIATGEFKQKIESTPIELRPNRPLHFYGNTVRRRHYRAIRKSSTRTVSRSTKASVKDAS